ncbi:MAG: D-alanyl-D-alanine carboxypeptidase/D-alanyl-D-alanine endopeptidase [Fimbriimonadaceae bacterium]
MTALLFLLAGQGLKADLDAIVASPALAGASVGILVTETDGRVLYEHEANRRLLPASNEKLLTCAFALSQLGPGFRPVTKFWTEPNALVVRSTGDPTISYDTLVKLREQLNPAHKPVIVSEAYRAGYPGTWELDDLPNRYAAPVFALTVDRGSLELWAVDGKVQLRPAPFDLTLSWANHTGPFHDDLDVFHRRLTLSGQLPKTTERLDTLGLPDTDVEAAKLLGPSVQFAAATPARTPDFVYTGDPIAKTLATCLQMSDNNLAENFLLMAASKGNDLDKPYDEAVPQLKAFLKNEMGIDTADADMSDGCGMSRHDFVTPAAINKVLRWALKQPTASLWRASLDHPGSGTMKTRLAGVAFQGKTGTMDRVSALSGYLDAGGRTVVVTILLNNYACPTKDAKEQENLLVDKIAVNVSGGTGRAIK